MSMETDKNNKIELEFTFNTPLGILFNRLSTASGLSEWFADDVHLDGDVFTFIWDGSETQAQLVKKQDNKCVRFNWLDDANAEAYFEFRISPDELAGGLALHVTEHLSDEDAEDKEDAESLWDSQINELKRLLGL